MLPGVRGEDVETIRTACYTVIRASVAQHRPDMATTWPATLEAETSRARQFREKFATNSTRLVAADASRQIMATILQKFHHDYTWGASAYVFLQMRGMKDIQRHGPTRGATIERVDELLKEVKKSNSHIFLDVAMELQPSDNDWSILPFSDNNAHLDLIATIFKVTKEELETGLSNLNPWCCLQQVGGIDISFKEPVGDFQVSYCSTVPGLC